MGKKGRPATKPAKLREGFYVELKNKGSNSPVKMRRNNMAEVEMLIKQYEKIKETTFLGELKDGRWHGGKNAGKKAN